jgi:hypothetical protein
MGRTPVERALVILEAAFPQVPRDLLAKLNVAQRDRCLLHLRALTFGPKFQGLIDCPACHQRLELEFNARDLPPSPSPGPDLETMKMLTAEETFHMNEYEVSFRLPNSSDLALLAQATDGSTAHQQLLEACIVSSIHEGNTVPISELPPDVLNAVLERMHQADPLTDLTLPAACPNCGQTSEIIFDIVSFFWSEINAWSARLVREVHALAMAYGWREADILGMSAWRRQQYLELMSV